MSLEESIINHMNEHHKQNLIALCKKFTGTTEVNNAILKGVDFEGLDIVYNQNQNLRIEFSKKANENTIKDTIIELCMSVESGTDFSGVEIEMKEFMQGFNSVCLATLSPKDEVVCSYAPFIQTEWGNFIYISEVSEHFANIKAHPKNIEIMFLEDESKASSAILRKRLRFKTEASFIERGEFFDKVYDEFEKKTGGVSGIKTIRTMLDFHLVKFEFKKGRFVKGFGQAYDIEEGKIKHLKGKDSGNPHKFPHKKA